MSFLTDLESFNIAGLADDIKTEAALILHDIASGFGAVGKTVEADVLAAIPEFTKLVKDYASQVVKSIETDPAFAGAAGSWKFGAAANLVYQAIVAGLPGFESMALKLSIATIETLVQGAVAGMLIA